MCWLTTCSWSTAYSQQPRSDQADKQEPKQESKVGERLVREVAEGVETDVMDEIMRMMSDAGRRLDIEFDPGTETRTIQREIVDRLNNAILLAAKQRRRSRQAASSSRDRRSRPDKPQPREAESDRRQSSAEASSSSDSASTSAPPANAETKAGDLRDTRRTWGHLPQRERDEVIQGSEEAHLERFRKWIERYYRALQESEE